MKTLDRPKKEVNIAPLMYQETTKVINYMRSSTSPSPIDQISITMLKNCPITRTMLTKKITYCWEHQYFLTKWKSGVTVLAYKSGSTLDSGNFRLITL